MIDWLGLSTRSRWVAWPRAIPKAGLNRAGRFAPGTIDLPTSPSVQAVP